MWLNNRLKLIQAVSILTSCAGLTTLAVPHGLAQTTPSPSQSPVAPSQSPGTSPGGNTQPPANQPPAPQPPANNQPPTTNQPPANQPPANNQPPAPQPPANNQPPTTQPPANQPPANQPPAPRPPANNQPPATNQPPTTQPPANQPPTTQPPRSSNQPLTQLLQQVSSNNGSFRTLARAVQAAGLSDALQSGDGRYTVFAPTDEAFAALPAGTLDRLLQPQNRELLRRVLAYHVVPQEVTSSQLRTGAVTTLGGGLAVRVTPERVIVNNGSVIQADIRAGNGVVHVVNRVLIPPDVRQQLSALR